MGEEPVPAVFTDRRTFLKGTARYERVRVLTGIFQDVVNLLESPDGLSAQPNLAEERWKPNNFEYLLVDPAKAEEATGIAFRQALVGYAANGYALEIFEPLIPGKPYYERVPCPALYIEFQRLKSGFLEDWGQTAKDLPFFKKLQAIIGKSQLLYGFTDPMPPG